MTKLTLTLASVYMMCSTFVYNVAAHGNMVRPAPRQVLNNGGTFGEGDVQSLSGGGTAIERENGHGLCGDLASRQQFMAPNQLTFPIVETYTQGATIDIEVDITAHHWGWFEFRLCRPADGGADTSKPITQECLNQHVLEFDYEYTVGQYAGGMRAGVTSPADYQGDGSYSIEHAKCEYLPDNGPVGSCCRGGGNCSSPTENKNRWILPDLGSRTYTMRYKLPPGVVCERCVLQWYYQTGNSPDSYPEGFWNCADIAITASNGGGDATTTAPTGTPTVSTITTTRSPVRSETQSPTTSIGDISSCHSIVAHISDQWCRDVQCDPVYDSFCRYGTEEPTYSTISPTTSTPVTSAPTPSIPVTGTPTTESSQTAPPSPLRDGECHSIVAHISDEWCRGVNCDPVYAQYCSTGHVSEPTTSSPTPLVTTTFSPTSLVTTTSSPTSLVTTTSSPTSLVTSSPTSSPTSLVTTTSSPTSLVTSSPTSDGTSPEPKMLNIVGYYGNSGNAVGAIPVLRDISLYYNTLIITFANFEANGELKLLMQGPYENNFDQLKLDIIEWKSVQDPYGRPRKVLFSIGGQNGHWPNSLSESVIYNAFTNFMNEYHLDGVDIDLEGSAVDQAASLANVITLLKADGKVVSAAPEMAQGPMTAYSSIIPLLDYLHEQFYNNGPNAVIEPFAPAQLPGSGWTPPPNDWQDATPAGLVGAGQPYWQSTMESTADYFGLKANQRGILIPATPNAAGNNNNWDIQLFKEQVANAGVVHVGTWAVAYDNKIGWEFARCMASTFDSSLSCP